MYSVNVQISFETQDKPMSKHSSNESVIQPVIVNRNVSTTLHNLLDLIFRDIVETALSNVTHFRINKISAMK